MLEPQVPASIAQYLRGYQRDGVRFLFQRFSAGEGGILGDDMGLGKTIQAIAFVSALLQMKGKCKDASVKIYFYFYLFLVFTFWFVLCFSNFIFSGTQEDKLRHCPSYIRNDIAPGIKILSVSPVLVICPASLSDNWFDEFQTWGHFKVLKLTTANRYCRFNVHHFSNLIFLLFSNLLNLCLYFRLDLLNIAKRKECDVLLVTYETARSSIDFLNVVDWTCVLLDEVHRIKETGSQISKALCSLRCKLRFGFTGTPFQVNLHTG